MMHGNKKGYNSHQNNYARINPSILNIYRPWVLIHQLFQFWGVADQNEEGKEIDGPQNKLSEKKLCLI